LIFFLDREKRLDKNGKAKLKDLEDKFKKILETKKVAYCWNHFFFPELIC
jgi:hypothetical protein